MLGPITIMKLMIIIKLTIIIIIIIIITMKIRVTLLSLMTTMILIWSAKTRLTHFCLHLRGALSSYSLLGS